MRGIESRLAAIEQAIMPKDTAILVTIADDPTTAVCDGQPVTDVDAWMMAHPGANVIRVEYANYPTF